MIGEYKLHSQGEFIVDEYCSINPFMEKVDEFKLEFSIYTSGVIKYLNLPKGTKVRLTLEIVE